MSLCASAPHPKKDNEITASSRGLLLGSVSTLGRSDNHLVGDNGTAFLLQNNPMLYNNKACNGGVVVSGRGYLGHGYKHGLWVRFGWDSCCATNCVTSLRLGSSSLKYNRNRTSVIR